MHAGPLVGVGPFWWDDLGCSVRPELEAPSVGGGVVAGFNDGVVVVVTEKGQVPQRSHSTGPPRLPVMGVAGVGWLVAAGEHTATIAEFQGCPDSGGDQLLGTAHVQDLRCSAQHRRHQVGVAQQLSQQGSRYRFGFVTVTGADGLVAEE